MKNKRLDARIVLGFAAVGCAAAVAATAPGGSLADCGAARLKGRLGERLDAMIERHVAATDVDYITAPFAAKSERSGGWQTEFWGKWMHSAVPYLAYTGSPKLRGLVERGIDTLLASQEPSGYIGNYPDELRCGEGWDVWGVKYTMMGLLHCHDGEREAGNGERAEKALSAAKKLCDYVICEIGPEGRRGCELWQTGNWSGYASSSILEPVVRLYRRVADKDGEDAARKYIDFAAYIVKGMTEPESGPRLIDLALKGVPVADRNGPGQEGPLPDAGENWAYVCKHGRGKAYEMMSCYQGILEYCEALSGSPRLAPRVSCPVAVADLLRAATMTAEGIAKDEVNLAGGCSSVEAWYGGARRQHLPYMRLQETCVTTTWMRFCEKLLCVTGDPKWADEMEKTFYNAYLAALSPDGSEFAGYTPLSGSRWHGQHHCHMHTDCCNSNGPRGFLCFLRELFRSDGRTATFNFYASAVVNGFEMYSLYPRESTARIVSRTEGPLVLRLRIPAWSAGAAVKVNGAAQPGVEAGSYFSMSRDWRPGDVVEVEFGMPVVAHALGGHVAFTRGPVLLARDGRFADGDISEVFRRGIRDGQTMPSFVAVRVPSDGMWMAFTAALPVGAHHENPDGGLPSAVSFCDYASAGGGWSSRGVYRTWFPVELAPESR